MGGREEGSVYGEEWREQGEGVCESIYMYECVCVRVYVCANEVGERELKRQNCYRPITRQR